MAGSVTSLPLPENPVLAEWASALNDAGHWAYVLDTSWRVVFVTDELAIGAGPTASLPVGCAWFSKDWISYFVDSRGGEATLLDTWRDLFRMIGPFILGMMPGGRESLCEQLDPSLVDLVAELEPVEFPHVLALNEGKMMLGGRSSGIVATFFRIDDDEGIPVGTALLSKPRVGMTELAIATATADLQHLARMRLVQRPDRRPTAILIADLEESSPLARRLSTAQYFSFGRRLVRAADQCVIDEGGIVGRHLGDGVVAYFLAETIGSESAAARSCIAAARTLRHTLAEIAQRSKVPEHEVSLRFGLHWGATLYIGRILTAGRSEVTALGDEVNETSRIEACATGGRTLASKSLIERLNHNDAEALGLDPQRTTYTPLAELSTATDKARRDAPSIAVCEL